MLRIKALCELQTVQFPEPSLLSVNMMPFVMGDCQSLPSELRQYVPLLEACDLEPEQIGKVGYLSIQESTIVSRSSQRRPGIHTEGHPRTGWGGGWGHGYMTDQRRDGIYMASTVERSCRAWDLYVEPTGNMGDCEHLRDILETTPATLMRPGVLYWLTDRTPHESLPVPAGTFRQWFRLVTHKVGLWYEQHSTANPLGIQPQCSIVRENKFD